ncbi:uncharacterized protein B0T15DRAFT_484142 [Chaetomium strumarium]|uniref:Ubiquitin carrier protein n=1 Tax=Chaetomium strumarium TaxID=1170767 RepID=A0AAJ0GVG0_9PEZI|nr:hypothetical protein B0T15DRAFT_484142 [Chaetomium strumarium]
MLTTLTVGGALAKRLVQDPPTGGTLLPSWIGWLFLGDVVLFLPILFVIGYTFGRVFPALAAVEDPLPAYEAVPLNDDDTPKDDNDPVHPGKPVTASIRATHRLLRSVGGWLSYFRGFGYAVAINIMTIMIIVPFYHLLPIIPIRVVHLFALYILTPWYVAWTHVVITPESNTSFLRRLVPFRRAFVATWFPTFLFWAATHVCLILPSLLAGAIGLDIELRNPLNLGPVVTNVDVGKSLCVIGVLVALQALLLIPAHTALVRVQASLLPADQDTIVPFDRSFGGLVAPEVVTGKGFASFTAALTTVSRASWLRIYLLRLKVFATLVAMYVVLIATVVLQVYLFSVKCEYGKDRLNPLKCT